MIKLQKNFTFLFLSIIGLSALGWFINSFPPEQWWQFAVFYLLIALTTFFLFQFILSHVRRALLLSVGVLGFFLLRSLNLRNPAYLILLLACILSIEYTFDKRKH